VLGGTVPVGAQLRIGTAEYLDVVETAEMMFDAALATEKKDCMIVYSCLGRFFALGARIEDEIETGSNLVHDRIPFLLSYTGGEICPVPSFDAEGREIGAVNKFHSFTIIACIL
ncbi:MAG: FIST C-terminal domain-containing protein, partial [Clostridiales Family XIII bacterium]|nr:FIST C-terminal domain-containing protein [Clostridiales Family XIII bacterium]